MTNVTVRTIQLELTTTKLTKGILAQMEEIPYEEMKQAFQEPGRVIGWVNGSALKKDEDYKTWLIVQNGEGSYGRYDGHLGHRKNYPQIYIV